ncbi:MAG: hypothetical protein A2204_04620 [Elusimicrobia bacterium RIFOXYA1_FULL_47_7]|nr:MAG: hypothetical protein A2204_04620 [Elusimicrobia bacterium RIFOXYA1_FULL_47_7]
MTKFFKKEVREHFAIEESVLFPLLEKILPPDVLDNLSEIENEHGPIIKKLDELDRISLQHLKYPSKTTRELFVKVCGEIIELLLPHARREDGDIFPAVRKIFSDANYRELENLYFKYMES